MDVKNTLAHSEKKNSWDTCDTIICLFSDYDYTICFYETFWSHNLWKKFMA